jgi:hypothetical protein
LRRVGASVLLLSVLVGATPALAHPAPFTYLDLRIERDAIVGTLIAHIFDVGHDLNLEPPDRLLQPSVAAGLAADVIALLAPRITLAVDGRTLTPSWSNVRPVPDRQALGIDVRYPITAPPGRVALTARFFPYDPAHQTFINLYEGSALTQAILDDSHTDFSYFTGTRQAAFAVARAFVPAGIRHIGLGADHLVFLVGLMLLGGTIRQLAAVVTAFTLANALTLTLGALRLVVPSPSLVEPAIALAIVYVGADNLIVASPGGGRDVRMWIAFTFGFIHGFGFANVLRAMNLAPRALGWAVLSFNAGVEIAQLAVVIVVVSVLSAVRARSEAAGRRFAVAGSVVVIVAGVFWFVQRVFFSGGIS